MTRPVPKVPAVGSRPTTGPALQMSEEQYEWEERAAILEYEAGHTRADAERLAREQMDAARRRRALIGKQETLWRT